jgi:hypothetical protein
VIDKSETAIDISVTMNDKSAPMIGVYLQRQSI